METLNKNQAMLLFEQEAVLVEKKDVVPLNRAKALFEKDIIETIYKIENSGIYWNTYSTYGLDLTYLTLSGFLAAVSYNNIKHLGTRSEVLS